MNKLKQAVAKKAVQFIGQNEVIGVGTGSTVDCFIHEIAKIKAKLKVVSSSERSAELMKSLGIEVISLNEAGDYQVYFDGADEIDDNLRMIKGGGGALTGEKICASAAREFICMVDYTKRVKILGNFPVPVEVIPMAQSLVARQIVKMGGIPKLRQNFVSDHGNIIIDVHGLKVLSPPEIENAFNQITGVVCCGIFAHNKADKAIIANKDLSISIIE